MNTALKIDPEFEAMCPPLTDEEFQQLEDNIVSDGEIFMPIIVWEGVIVDGHNRYKIAQTHPDIGYRTHDKEFANRYEAISWICNNQLGRRNLTSRQKKLLIGQRYEADKMARGAEDGFRGNQYTALVKDKKCPLPDTHITLSKIAQETKTTPSFVRSAGQLARGIAAAEEVLPGITSEIMSGVVKPTDSAIAAIAKAAPEERRQKAEALRVKPEKPSKDIYKAGSSSSPSKSMKDKRQELKEIRALYSDMRDENKDPVNEDDILETLRSAVISMIRICDTLFLDFPRLLSDAAYKAKVIEIMQEPKQYILEIEGEEK